MIFNQESLEFDATYLLILLYHTYLFIYVHEYLFGLKII